MGRNQKAPCGAFCLAINIIMLKLKYSGLFPPKHESPIGKADSYYQSQKPAKKKRKPAQKQPKQ